MKESSSSSSSSEPVVVVPYWVKIVSGSVGSMVTAFAVTPLEVVKVRQQSQLPSAQQRQKQLRPPANVTPCPRGCGTFVFHNGLTECLLPKNAVPYFDKVTGEYLPKSICNNTTNSSNTWKASSSSSANAARNHGTFQMLRRIFATEGLSGIYAGLAPTLVMGVPNTVLYFITYEELALRLRRSDTSFGTSTWAPAVAGGAARLIASASTAPLELIRTRQAARIGSDQPAGGGMIQELATIIRKEGFMSLYRGLSPTLFRDVPFSAVYWYCIESMREQWRKRREYNNTSGQPQQPISALQQAGQGLINGSISGMIAAACTTPLDVIKTRRQTEFLQLDTAVMEETAAATLCDHEGAAVYNPKTSSRNNSSGVPRGTLQMMTDIYAEEGVSGLWKGNQARMIKVAPACAIMISSYEVGKRLLSDDY